MTTRDVLQIIGVVALVAVGAYLLYIGWSLLCAGLVFVLLLLGVWKALELLLASNNNRQPPMRH